MHQLKIDLSELEIAFETSRDMASYYLDIETGDILMVTAEEDSLLEDIYQTFYDKQSRTVDWETAFQEEGVPDWQHERLQEADRIKASFGSRFIIIPSDSSHEGYRDMVDFIMTVQNPRLQERLERAISGRGAFRHF